MKSNVFRGSVLNGSNKVISESNSDWSSIRPGSIIKFNEDEGIYKASSLTEFLYIKDFEVVNNRVIKVRDNTAEKLIKGDTLVLTYKEYELSIINGVTSGGQNYKVGDTLIIDGGIPSFNTNDGLKEETKVRVIEVVPGGGFLKYSIEKRGRYIEIPAGECKLNGGSGSGAVINVGYKLIDSRTTIERDIQDIKVGDISEVTLLYDIPSTIRVGKLSCSKQELQISSEYAGKNQIGGTFSIARDFTLNYGWPLPITNSFSLQTIMTEVLHLQDKKIKELEDRINRLEKKPGEIQLS